MNGSVRPISHLAYGYHYDYQAYAKQNNAVQATHNTVLPEAQATTSSLTMLLWSKVLASDGARVSFARLFLEARCADAKLLYNSYEMGSVWCYCNASCKSNLALMVAGRLQFVGGIDLCTLRNSLFNLNGFLAMM
ncbi:uncharacterized protein MEPE_05570 [Melanopsichium pennsylvanicum]|uniref:Uncharacterized protein n=1 Tax=Melanopsichium pennsylvanicum TaxID=63383 RepID=A0AAJ4XS33_9BASI|nr:uncharacterized protein MEPE_05570 [Melanopsichium pennsylvanicum]